MWRLSSKLMIPVIVFGLISGSAFAATHFDDLIIESKKAMMSDPERALSLAHSAETQARAEAGAEVRDTKLDTAQWLQGEALMRLHKVDKALPLLQTVVADVKIHAPKSKLYGDVLKSHGKASAASGQIQQALGDFQNALGVYRASHESRAEAMALQEIGSIYMDAHDYIHARQYYDQSQEVYDQDPALNLTSNNNIGFSYKDQGDFNQAELHFRKAYDAATAMESPYLQASILANIAYTEALAHHDAKARKDIALGLTLISHNPEAAEQKPFFVGVQARLAFDSGRFMEAVHLMDQMFAGQNIDKTSMDFLDFHELAARIYQEADEPSRALSHLQAYQRLDSQGRELARSTNAALLAARFDFANQSARISQLKIKQAESQSRWLSILISIISLASAVVVGLITHAFLSMRRSRNRIQLINRDLEKALKAKTEFLATTSHEIRTPLNGILGMTQVMLADRTLPSDINHRLILLKSSGDSMNALVNDLLDVAKIETGHLSIAKAPMNLKRIVEDACKVWEDKAATKGLTLNLHMSDCPEDIISDADRIRQVLFNLLSNAIKFTEKGSVDLMVNQQNNEAGNHFVITVRDTGIGISAEDHKRIFESFIQVDGAKTRQFGGTGLGLTICKNIAEALGGQIEVDSLPSEGASFKVSLPLEAYERPRIATPVTDGSSSAKLKTCSLLCVDDNPLAQSLIRAIIGPNVHSVSFAVSLNEASEACKIAPIDRVILDGAFFLRHCNDAPIDALKSFLQDVKVPVTVLWSDTEIDCEQLKMDTGVDQVLKKPISPQALMAALAETVSERSPLTNPSLASQSNSGAA